MVEYRIALSHSLSSALIDELNLHPRICQKGHFAVKTMPLFKAGPGYNLTASAATLNLMTLLPYMLTNHNRAFKSKDSD